MTRPITMKFKQSKQFLMQALPETAQRMKMETMGSHKKLGLMSFRQDRNKMYYAHIVELKSGKALVSIAPGLSYLKDRNPDESQKKIIKQIMVELNNVCERRENN